MTLEEKINELKGLNKEPLLEKAIELATENSEIQKQIAELEGLVEELNAELKNLGKQKAGNGFKVLSINGKDYRFTAPKFERKGTVYITNDLDENSPVVAELLEIGSGLLEEIVESETED